MLGPREAACVDFLTLMAKKNLKSNPKKNTKHKKNGAGYQRDQIFCHPLGGKLMFQKMNSPTSSPSMKVSSFRILKANPFLERRGDKYPET